MASKKIERKVDAVPTADTLSFASKSKYVKSLEPNDRYHLNEIEKQFREDTDNGLTEVEYYELSTLRFMCEDIEEYIKKYKIENVDKELLAEYLRAKEHITDTMRRYRESKKERKADLGDLKKAFFEFSTAPEVPKTFDVPKKVVKEIDLDEELCEDDDD